MTSYTITHTHAGSTAALGYHRLAEYAGPVHHAPVPQPVPTSQPAAFRQGIGDAIPGQDHHMLRQLVTGFIVGAAVGEVLQRARRK